MNKLLGIALSVVLSLLSVTTAEAAQQVKTNVEQESVLISIAGDCTLGSYKGSSNRFADYWQQGAEYYLDGVSDVFDNDDITFVNLEGPLTYNPQQLVKQFSMRGEPEYVDILTSGSVEVVNLSNNHIYDCGQIGFDDTINLLADNNINYCGEGYKCVVNKNNINVGFLGYKGWSDDENIRNKIAGDIKELKNSADIVIVMFHWGNEREFYPVNTQTSLGYFSIDSGADMVVGAHSHCLQGIEKYKGKVIAYSLGNFCFGANNNPKDKDTMILQAEFKKDGQYTVNVVPCKISSVDNINDFRPTIVTDDAAEKILNRLKEYSSVFKESIF